MEKKLLIVDDEEFFLQGLKDGLSEYNNIFTTDICSSVSEAKELQEKNCYDLIISDIRMPGESGLDLFLHLNNTKFEGGFIAMTSYGTEELIRNVHELGGLEVFLKPFDFSTFSKKILDYFDLSASEDVIHSDDMNSLFQLINLEKRTVVVKIDDEFHSGIIYFENGEIIHAIYKEFEGLDAAKFIISMKKGKFSFVKNGEVVPKTIDVPFMALMMDSKISIDGLVELPEDDKEVVMDVDKLSQAIENQKYDMGEGLIATDIFSTLDGQSIAGFNTKPKACALFNQVSSFIKNALDESDFPEIGKYYAVDLVDDQMIIVLMLGDYRWGMLIDRKHVPFGMLLNILIPKMIKSFEDAKKNES